MNKIVIANMFRAKNKQSFFAMHQIYTKIKKIDSSIDIEFNILWDGNNELNLNNENKWEKLMDNFGFNIISYDKKFFIDYCTTTYGLDSKKINSDFKKYPAIFLILIPHYLRRVKLYDNYLMYDDDIIINYDFRDVVQSLLNNIPVLISEPFNANCDKVLLEKIINLYGVEAFDLYKQRNPKMLGFNAGFQGVDLSIFDDFLSPDRFKMLIELFDYSGIIDGNGNEIWDFRRFLNDTQQQSFTSCMNIIKAKHNPHVLDELTCYVAPNFGHHPILGTLNSEDINNGWGCCLQSKISHFIGHTRGKSKPIQFLNKVDEYLKNEGII